MTAAAVGRASTGVEQAVSKQKEQLTRNRTKASTRRSPKAEGAERSILHEKAGREEHEASDCLG